MTPIEPLSCFKAYDIRGRLGKELNEDIAYRIGRAFAQVLGAKRVVLGRDCRPSSQSLAAAVARGLTDARADVLDLGLSGTEESYFATTHYAADGGICVTASHNPMDYNGMKMVRRGSAPLDNATGMAAIKALAESGGFADEPNTAGQIHPTPEARAAYVQGVLGFLDVAALRPLKILVNAGNGAAGPTFDAIAHALAERGAPLDFVRMHHTPDGSFPHGIPNPLLVENQPVTANAVLAEGADLLWRGTEILIGVSSLTIWAGLLTANMWWVYWPISFWQNFRGLRSFMTHGWSGIPAMWWKTPKGKPYSPAQDTPF